MNILYQSILCQSEIRKININQFSKDELFKYFPESWYPLCLSSELRKNEVKKINAFSGHLVCYRGKNGKVGVLKQFCPHMGTDLSNSKVVEDCLECPFHLRKYNPEGKCTGMYGHNKVPNNAHTQSLEVIEKFNIVFVYFGTDPKFSFPTFSRVENQEEYYSSNVANYFLNTPYQSLLFNGFDTHHLGCIHSRVVSDNPQFIAVNEFLLTAEYSMKVLPNRFYDKIVQRINTKENHVKLESWGGNFLIITLKDTKDNILITSLPINEKESRIFLTSMTSKSTNIWTNVKQYFRLKLTTILGVEFLKPDIKIIENMRPEIRGLYNELDIGVIEFWKYWDKLPRDKSFQDSFFK